MELNPSTKEAVILEWSLWLSLNFYIKSFEKNSSQQKEAKGGPTLKGLYLKYLTYCFKADIGRYERSEQLIITSLSMRHLVMTDLIAAPREQKSWRSLKKRSALLITSSDLKTT